MDDLRFRFEDHVLDVARRELTRAGAPVALEPQVFDLLVYVIRNRDRVVSKDDLVEAVWGGRIVSDSTLTTRINAMRKALGDSGEQQRLIRTVARKGIRFVGAVAEGDAAVPAAPASLPEPALSLPDKPSIAVLPFQNMSDDPSQEYFCDGMVEEIITALSRFQWLFVIARNSSFTYKGRAIDVKQVAYELGVRYVLEGSVRKAGQRVRITGQLIDATTGAHLWVDKFDGDLADVFELQDKVASSVVVSIEPRLKEAEVERAKRKPARSLDAYDLYLQALKLSSTRTRDGTAAALDLLGRAISVNPGYAIAYARSAHLYVWRTTNGWTENFEADAAEAIRLARTAVNADRNDADVLHLAGAAFVFFATEVDVGLTMLDRSVAMNANCAYAWTLSGQARVYVGDHDKALEYLDHSVRLSPLDPELGLTFGLMAFAHMFEGRFEEAIAFAHRSRRERPGFPSLYRVLAASYAHLGKTKEAEGAARELLRVDPKYSLKDRVRRGYAMFQNPKVGLYIDGLRKAGLSE